MDRELPTQCVARGLGQVDKILRHANTITTQDYPLLVVPASKCVLDTHLALSQLWDLRPVTSQLINAGACHIITPNTMALSHPNLHSISVLPPVYLTW